MKFSKVWYGILAKILCFPTSVSNFVFLRTSAYAAEALAKKLFLVNETISAILCDRGVTSQLCSLLSFSRAREGSRWYPLHTIVANPTFYKQATS
jgi:hypothetical protein